MKRCWSATSEEIAEVDWDVGESKLVVLAALPFYTS